MTHHTIRYGSRGDDVIAWQRILDVTRDGVFGVRTQTATETWQRARGLHPDGIVGPKTWAVAEAEEALGAPVVAAPVNGGSALAVPPSGRVASLVGADEATIRATIVALAVMRAGLGAKGDPERYARAIGCHREPASFRHSYVPTKGPASSNASCCGLCCRAILADSGCEHALLVDSYGWAAGSGWVMGQLERVGLDYGAVVRPASGAQPLDGDIVMLGPSPGGRSNHVFTVIDAGRSVDGGQGGGFGGGTETRIVERSWRRAGSRLYTRTRASEREVLWWLNVARLQYTKAIDWPAW